MNRRGLLLSAVSFGGLGALSLWAVKASGAKMSGMMMSSAGMNMGGMHEATDRIKKLPTGAPLSDLTKLSNTATQPGQFSATIEAAPAQHEFVPGLKTEVLAYNGALPGAMIEVFEGDRVKINFKNRIPDQDSTIHWHGLEIPSDQDGNPSDPVASGTDHIYEFTIPEGSAGTYWYHPHPHGTTAEQVYRGLAAPFIVRSKTDPLSPGLGDTPLVISSISLDVDGKISENTMADQFNGREGDHVLVNGTKQPILTLAPGSSRRFRLYNATNGRFLRLALDSHSMTLVGTDGGLVSAPIKGLKELLLAPAERAEIVIDFHGAPGTFALKSLPYERGWMGMDKPAAKTITIMTFALAGSSVQPIALPEKLRDIATLGEAKAQKRIQFTETMGMGNGMMTMGFQIDGKTFDMNRIDLKSRVGEVELWEIYNNSDMDHPLHIHGTQFQIVERERDKKFLPVSFVAWKDTVNITSKETVRLKLRFNLAGNRMYHCHILEHEEQGMMGTLQVA
jgi:FtsP/CotA-like multicopper oxidase with cupredoxin domain